MAGYYLLVRRVLEQSKRKYAPDYYRIHERVSRVTRRNPQTILEKHRGRDPNCESARAAVFVHFDRQGRIDDYVLAYLEKLRDAGFRIWMMSNTPRLTEEVLKKVEPLVTWVYRRNNFGFDFGAYKDGVLSVMESMAPEQLLLCNDSVYGPFRPIDDVLASAKQELGDVWGLTESFEVAYHLQSYFVLFHNRAVKSAAFLDYWKKAPYVDARGWLIHHGEIGLTQAMFKGGLSVRAVYPTDAISDAIHRKVSKFEGMQARFKMKGRAEEAIRRYAGLVNHIDNGLPLNPTHFFWDLLITDLGFPFIKRDLLQLNPAHIPDLSSWRNVIGSSSDYDVELIRRHLLPRLRHRRL